MKHRFTSLALSALLLAGNLLHLSTSPVLASNVSRSPGTIATFQLQEDDLSSKCYEQEVTEFSAKVEKPLVDYGRDTPAAATSRFCIERKNARLEEARQNFLNAVTPAFIFRQQAADLYEHLTARPGDQTANGATNEKLLSQLRSYPERAKHHKTRLSQLISEINRTSTDVALALNRYQATSQEIQQGLQGENLQILAESQQDIEAKMRAALGDLQTAREVFEWLELKINVSSGFLAILDEEAQRTRKSLAESKGDHRALSEGMGTSTVNNEKVLLALQFLSTVDQKMVDSAPIPPLTPTIKGKAQADSVELLTQEATKEVPTTQKRVNKPSENQTINVIAVTPEAPRPTKTTATQTETPNAVKAIGSIDDAQVETFLQQWVKAWRNQDIPAYLSCYAETFTPANGKSRENWQAERSERLSKPKFIKLDVTAQRVERQQDGTWRIDFLQRYSSDFYSDSTKKALFLKQFDSRLLIVREETIGSL